MTAPGGQAGASSRIENYLGFPRGITGAELTQAAVIQAEKFGAQLTTPCRATLLRSRGGYLIVELSDGTEVTGRAVVAATGAAYRRLEADRLSDFEGRGVYYAATELEARQCSGAPVLIVGGGNSAGQAAIFMAQHGCSVSIVIRGGDLRKSMSSYLVQRIESDPAITVRTATTIAALDGDERRSGQCACERRTRMSWFRAAASSRSSAPTPPPTGSRVAPPSMSAASSAPSFAHGRGPGRGVGAPRSGAVHIRDELSRALRRGESLGVDETVASAVGEGSASVRAVHQYLAFSS